VGVHLEKVAYAVLGKNPMWFKNTNHTPEFSRLATQRKQVNLRLKSKIPTCKKKSPSSLERTRGEPAAKLKRQGRAKWSRSKGWRRTEKTNKIGPIASRPFFSARKKRKSTCDLKKVGDSQKSSSCDVGSIHPPRGPYQKCSANRNFNAVERETESMSTKDMRSGRRWCILGKGKKDRRGFEKGIY